MNWNDIVRKITSRRLWVAVAGIVTGVALAHMVTFMRRLVNILK